MIKKVIPIHKPVGISPVQAINEFRKNNPEYNGLKISPAGRLDPLAQGVMVLLVGDENKKRREYEKSDKTYEFKAILGVSTDSYDICGIATKGNLEDLPSETEIKEILQQFIGRQQQLFPPYSSYKIKSKPLFKYARDGRLGEIQIPSKEIEIYNMVLQKVHQMTGDNLHELIKSRIHLLNGDFRQDKVLDSWRDVLNLEHNYTIIDLKTDVSSGTYIRSIVNDLGIKLGCMATTLEISRIKSGEYSLDNLI